MRFTHLLALAVLSILLVGCSKDPAVANQDKIVSGYSPSSLYQEGKHYSRLQQPIVEPNLAHYLTEYFWLGCPHCQNFEPLLKGYLAQNPKVTLVRKHPALGERWAIDASIFYGLTFNGHEHLIDPLFELYRQTRIEQNALPDNSAITAFLQHHKIDLEVFSEQLQDEAIIQAMEQANREMLDNRLRGVPSLVVNGKYLVNGEQPADIKTQEDYYQLLDYLLSKP